MLQSGWQLSQGPRVQAGVQAGVQVAAVTWHKVLLKQCT